MSKRNDSTLYRELSKPFATNEEANTAVARFFDAVEAARREFRIPDVVVACEIGVESEEGEVRAGADCQFGDELKQLPMVARLYGALQERHTTMLQRISQRARLKERK